MRAEDIFRRGQPQKGRLWVLLYKMEGDLAFSRAGGEDHRGPVLVCQHPLHGLADLRLVGIQFQCHGVPSFPCNGRSIPLPYLAPGKRRIPHFLSFLIIHTSRLFCNRLGEFV